MKTQNTLFYLFIALFVLIINTSSLRELDPQINHNTLLANDLSSLNQSETNNAKLNTKIKIDLSKVMINVFDHAPYMPNLLKSKASIALLDELIDQNLPGLQKECLLLFRYIQILRLELEERFVVQDKNSIVDQPHRTRKQIYKDLRSARKKLYNLKKRAKKQRLEFASQYLAQMYEIAPSLAVFLPEIGIGQAPHYFFQAYRLNNNPFNNIDWKKLIVSQVYQLFAFYTFNVAINIIQVWSFYGPSFPKILKIMDCTLEKAYLKVRSLFTHVSPQENVFTQLPLQYCQKPMFRPRLDTNVFKLPYWRSNSSPIYLLI